MPNFLHRTSSSTSHRTISGFISSTISRTSSPDPKPTILSSATPIEEETQKGYKYWHWYPTKIGEKINDRYEVLAKLGYGMTATVWLARDMHASPGPNSRKYVTIKINVNTLEKEFLASRRAIATALFQGDTNHPGYPHVRFMLDTFRLRSKHGEHLCIVYDVLREPLDECQRKFAHGVFGSDKLRKLLPALLKGLDYLHAECHVVHTDLKPDNIMMGLGDNPSEVLDRFMQYQQAHPTPRKLPDSHDRDNHIVYKSCSDLLLVGNNDKGQSLTDAVLASAKITDLGLAEWGNRGLQYRPIQSNAFTCPEVVLETGWSYPADIWNLGTMIWDLIESEGLFDQISHMPSTYRPEQHLALMICLLGPAPKILLDRGLKTGHYYDYNRDTEEYVFKFQKYVDKWQEHMSWDRAVTHMQGENKESFIDFAKKMITWLPEDRWTASQLLEHPWLKARPGTVISTVQDYAQASSILTAGAKRDSQIEQARQSQASSQPTDTDDSYFTLPKGMETPPQGISKASTATSFMSVGSLQKDLPNPVVIPSK